MATVTKTKNIVEYTLVLSAEEATLLRDILGSATGNFGSTRRTVAEGIWDALRVAEVPRTAQKDIKTSLVFGSY